MYFDEALKFLRQGKRLTRESWGDAYLFIKLQMPDENSKMLNPYIYMDATGTTSNISPNTKKYRFPWNPSHIDILAGDWIVINTMEDIKMKNFVYRIMIMPNAGHGNPNQYKLMPVFKKGNYDLFAVNANNENENFVLLARIKDEFAKFGDALFNNYDTLNIVDFIYDLAFKAFDERDTMNTRYTFEIDFSNSEILNYTQQTDIDRKSVV